MRVITTKGFDNLVTLLKDTLDSAKSDKDKVSVNRYPGHSQEFTTDVFQFIEIVINEVAEIVFRLTFSIHLPDILVNLLPGQIVMDIYVTLADREVLLGFDLVQLENNDIEVKKLANLISHALSKHITENIQNEVNSYQLQVNYLENLSRLLGNVSSIEED